MEIENVRKIISDSTTMTAVEVLAFAEAIEQLAEAKRLLRLAVEDFEKSLGVAYTCPYCKYVERKHEVCASRKEQYCGDICEWRYADEALKLLGGSENG